jgi:transposase-like protein
MTISFARHPFPPAIIRRAVWLYARFTLSYRDVEDLRCSPENFAVDAHGQHGVGISMRWP